MLALRWPITLILFAVVSSLARATGVGQNDPAQSKPGEAVRLIPRSEGERERASQASHHIILDVAVSDASGHAVPGLTAKDFNVVDGGQPQAIKSFRDLYHDDTQPAHAILVLDAENNSSHDYGAERKAVEKFLTESHGALPLPVAIARISDAGTQTQPASRDPGVLLAELRALPGDVHDSGSTDGTASHEMDTGVRTAGSLPSFAPRTVQLHPHQDDQNQRFLLSISELEKMAVRQEDVPGRAIVVWVGSGWPLLDGPGFRPDTPELQSRFFDHIVGVSTEIREAQMTLNAVVSPDGLREAGLAKGYYDSLLSGVTAPTGASAGDLALPVLAVQSGGRFLDQTKDVAAEIAECLAHAASAYQLSFESRPSRQPDEYRPLQVQVDRAGLIVRTSAGYYAEP